MTDRNPETDPAINPEMERKRMEAAYRVFELFALQDQRGYYRSQVKRNRTAATQVNRIRAIFALLTGLASALAGLIVTLTPTDCQSARLLSALNDTGVEVFEVTPEFAPTLDPSLSAPVTRQSAQSNMEAAGRSAGCTVIELAVPFLLILAVLAPALGGAFGTLSDLFQWDRLVNIYEVALENLEVADARSPVQRMDDEHYRASLKGYTEGTLAVMRDETAQWGQVIRTPEALEKFVARELELAGKNVEGMPDATREFIRGEIDRLTAINENANQQLEEIRQQLAAALNRGENPPPPLPPA